MNVERLLSQFGLRQKDLAGLLGVNPATVIHWRRQGRMPETHYRHLMEKMGAAGAARRLRQYLYDRSGMGVAGVKNPENDPHTAFARLAEHLEDRRETAQVLASWTLADAAAEGRPPTPQERERAYIYLEWGGFPKRSIWEPEKAPEELEKEVDLLMEKLKRLLQTITVPSGFIRISRIESSSTCPMRNGR